MTDERRGKYFEEFVVGEEYESPGRTITETDLVLYAGLSGDYNQLHTDEEYCKKVSIFKKRILHGLFGLTLVEGLKSRWDFSKVPRSHPSNGVEISKTLFVGDTVRVKWRIAEKRETKKPDGAS